MESRTDTDAKALTVKAKDLLIKAKVKVIQRKPQSLCRSSANQCTLSQRKCLTDKTTFNAILHENAATNKKKHIIGLLMSNSFSV